MDDEGDFKKARGFLLTYSALVLALLFFQAELTSFNLMGVSLSLVHHKESIWLVLALLNAYFWFRCYQRVPRDGLYFDNAMHDLYDHDLVWVSNKLKRWTLKRLAEDQFTLKHDPSEQMRIFGYSGIATGRESREEEIRKYGEDVGEIHRMVREYRTKMQLRVGYEFTDKGQWSPFPVYAYLDYRPSAAVTWPVKAVTIARGAFITPWFTDHVMPLVLGGISTGFALWKWCDMNFFTTTLPHLAQSCAGVTH